MTTTRRLRLAARARRYSEVLDATALQTLYPKPRNVEYGQNGPWRYITHQMLIQATEELARQLPPGLSGVAGIPRSGLLPACLLSVWHHLPLYELSTANGLQPLGHGMRGMHIQTDSTHPMLVVDDTVYNGYAMRAARQQMQGRAAVYSAVFVRPGHTDAVDLYGQVLPSPHLLEWCLWNTGLVAGWAQHPALRGGIAMDFDGVLCEDCPAGMDGDDTSLGDERYRHWLANARPKRLPRMLRVPLIVTFRLEKFRKETEHWLQKWGISCDQLVMHPARSFAERQRQWNAGAHKGDVFRASPCGIFIESDCRQAKAIWQAARKPVLALDTNVIYQ